jgi:hypothetical protein
MSSTIETNLFSFFVPAGRIGQELMGIFQDKVVPFFLFGNDVIEFFLKGIC